jgi:hypothetical protein
MRYEYLKIYMKSEIQNRNYSTLLKSLGAPEPIPNRATHNPDLRDPLHFWARLPDKETRTQNFPFFFLGTEQRRGGAARPSAAGAAPAASGGAKAMPWHVRTPKQP